MKRLLIILLVLFLLNAGHATAKPLGRVELTGRTPSRLLQSDSNTRLEVVENLCASYIDGTANQIVCTDAGDGTVTLDFPDAVSITTSLTVPLVQGAGGTGNDLTFYSNTNNDGIVNIGDFAYFVEATGRVGLLTDAPDEPLHVNLIGSSEGIHVGSWFIGNAGVAANALLSNYALKGDANAYAFLQSPSGKSFFNAKSGQYISFNIGNSTKMRLIASGFFGINQTTPLAQLHIVPNATTTIGQIIQLAASQTANAFEVQDSATNILASIDKDGGLETEGNREKKEILIVFGDSPYTVLPNDHIINCDSDGGPIEIDYPAGTSGRELTINGVGASGNDCSLDPNGAEEIYAGGAGVAFVMHDGEVFDTRYNSTKGWR